MDKINASFNENVFTNASTTTDFEYFKQTNDENTNDHNYLIPALSEQMKTCESIVFNHSNILYVSNSTAALQAAHGVDKTESGEIITINGESGVWVNKSESVNWKGPIPLTEYTLNEDPNPEVIRKKTEKELVYNQEIAIRYLRPPTPPPPGDIVIKQEKPIVPPLAPPLIIRQQPPRPETPSPLIIREMPPKPPISAEPKVIKIPAKRLPPAPRKVIIERLPPLPMRPQSIIIERWLPYKKQKRKVIFANEDGFVSEPDVHKEKNVIIQWEPPKLKVKKEFKDLGVIKVNPTEYINQYGSTLKTPKEIAEVIPDFKFHKNVVLAAETNEPTYDLIGDIHALSLVDLEREGLEEYKKVFNFNEPRHVNSNSSSKLYHQNSFKSISSLKSQTSSGNSIHRADSGSHNIEKNISVLEARSIVVHLTTKFGPEVDFSKRNELMKELDEYPEKYVDLEIFKRKLKSLFKGFNL